MANSNNNNSSSSNGNNNSGSSSGGGSSGTISNNSSRDVEERLAFLEREANYWRVKFEELEKWRENLEDWVIANIGVPNRARTPASNSNNNNNNNNSRWIKSSPSSQLSSPSNNGWSPDSSDASTSVNNNNNNTTNAANNFQAKSLSAEDGGGGRRSTYDFDSQEDNTDDNTHGVAKRKRGRPKKTPDLNPPGSNFPNGSVMGNSNVVPSSDMKTEGSEMNHWGFGGESGNVQPAVPVKRGRGRPRKIKTDEEDDDKERKKPGRKKRDPATLLSKACDLCGMEFESNQDLMSHKRIVHPDKFHKCTVCNETYLHPGFLARHMETHTLDRDFKCHMCISSFNTYQLLKLHCTEKHGVEAGRQCDWKRDGELSMGMNRVPMDSYGLGQQQQQQQQPPQSSSSLMSPSVPNCGIPGNDLVRNDLMNPHNVSSHQQFMQQQQRQQQQHAAMMQQQQQQQHHNHLQQQIHSPHHMHLQQQQQQNPVSHPHHSQHLQHQQQQPSLPHNLHHNHNHNHQNLQHQQQQQLQHSFSTEDEDENDIDGSGFSLDFACNGSDTLPSLFDPAVSDTAMGNYLNSIEPDSLQLY